MNKVHRIFIVEDSLSMNNAMEKHLINEFGDSIVINQFDSVEAVLENDQFTPDIMLLDHILHETKGVDSIRMFMQKYPKLKIAIISGQNDIKVFSKAYSQGALDYVRKDTLFFHNIADFIKTQMTTA